MGAPEEIVRQLLLAGHAERGDRDAQRSRLVEDVADGAVLARVSMPCSTTSSARLPSAYSLSCSSLIAAPSLALCCSAALRSGKADASAASRLPRLTRSPGLIRNGSAGHWAWLGSLQIGRGTPLAPPLASHPQPHIGKFCCIPNTKRHPDANVRDAVDSPHSTGGKSTGCLSNAYRPGRFRGGHHAMATCSSAARSGRRGAIR